MSKGMKTIYTDIELWDDFEQIVGKGNVSKAIARFQEEYIRTKKGTVNDINDQILDAKLEKQEKALSKNKANYEALKAEKERRLKQAEERKLKGLEAEKKAIEDRNNCVICSSQIDDARKFHEAWREGEKTLYVHDPCFRNWCEGRVRKGEGYTLKHLKAYLKEKTET